MDMERYNTLKNALIVEKNDKILDEFKKLMMSLDKEQADAYSLEYSKYDYMSLTLEEEEERVSNIVDLIKKRESNHNEFEDDYSYITGETPDFLSQVLYIDKLKDLEQRLNTIKDYLAIKERIVNLSVNIKEYKKEMASNPDNRRLQTKLNKSTKKINDLLNSLKKENILIMLYEFCIIDTFDKDKVNNGEMLKNILSTKVKKKEEQVLELKKEEKKEIKDNKKAVVKEKVNDKQDSLTNKSKSINKELVNNNEQQESNSNYVISDISVNDNISNDNIKIIDKSDNDYMKDMIPEGMPMLSQIGTVKPVTMMEKLEKAQKEEGNLTIPSMGMLDNQDVVEIDSNEYLKNDKKSSKIA